MTKLVLVELPTDTPRVLDEGFMRRWRENYVKTGSHYVKWLWPEDDIWAGLKFLPGKKTVVGE